MIVINNRTEKHQCRANALYNSYKEQCTMYESIHYSDLPMLMGRGFKFGMFDTVLWGKDRDNQEYQAVIVGEWIKFGQRLPKGNVASLEQMSREEFDTRFVQL